MALKLGPFLNLDDKGVPTAGICKRISLKRPLTECADRSSQRGLPLQSLLTPSPHPMTDEQLHEEQARVPMDATSYEGFSAAIFAV
jgi:hypothetical protein